ncbi:hypothetical protein KPH14_009438 [Odynerus spinipes]|uniref:Uncharacterized protein n=1 Tax=Odynerus spinipes TaxID=1348599 RepID=A0AAD9RPG4_9HYME|nr:hypothetical protein KPH14_009438 [Odynerus spinipes]
MDLTRTKHFAFKERRRFDGYPLRISIFETVMMSKVGDEYGGPEGTFVNLVCRKMNVTPIYIETPNSFGWTVNGVFTGALAEIAYDRADVCFNQFFVKNHHTTELVSALYLGSDELCVLTPKASPVPGHLVILRIFTVQSWILIILTHAIVSLVYTRMRMTRDEHPREARKTHVKASLSNFGSSGASGDMYDTLRHERNTDAKLRTVDAQILETEYDTGDKETRSGKYHNVRENARLCRFVTTGKTLDPVCISSLIKYLTEVFLQLLQPLENARPHFPERLVLICNLIMGLILSGIFTSQLTSHYSKRTYFKEIRSLEDLKEIGLPILTSARDVLQDAIGKDDHLELKKYDLRMEYANDTEMRRRLIYTKDAAILRRREFIRWKYNDEEVARINVIENCPITYVMAPLLKRGSPFLKTINQIIGQLHNGGLYRKWLENALYDRQLANFKRKPKEHQKLTIDHFCVPFVIWFIGLAIGTIVFAFERKLFNVPRFLL